MPEEHDFYEKQMNLASIYEISLNCLRCVESAIVHPLGFSTLPKLMDKSGGYSRVHIWRRDLVIQQIPHSHSSHLRSTILLGKLRNTFWIKSEPSRGDTQIFTIDKGLGEQRHFRFSGTGNFVSMSTQDFEPGDVYEVEAGKFHSNECLSDLCITHVHRRASSGMLSQIALPASQGASNRRVRSMLSKSEIGAIIVAVEAEAKRLKNREISS
jgi:hypothetical protein